MIKIDIISGFLGAGKTTLIKQLIEKSFQGEDVVLIENEFGEIGIDSGFLKESNIEIREMNSGCICCSLVGDFSTSLKEVIEKYHPARIIIEPSGVGKLSDVIKAVETVTDAEVVLNSATTVVDGNKCKMYMKNFGEFFNNQIEYADAILLSRTDLISEKKVKDALELIRNLNQKAIVVTTPITELTGEKLLEILDKTTSLEKQLEEEHHHHECCGHHHEHEHDHECCGHHHEHEHDHECCGHHHEHEHDHECCGHHHDHEHHHEHGEECTCGCHDHEHHHHHADEVFTSYGFETTKTYSKDELEEILEKLANTEDYGTVLRAKGMIQQTDSKEWLHFDLVPGEYDIRTGQADYIGKICVIGSKLDKEKLEELI
ncbi:MAG: GTP-binding protein [Lachnospiraceae bacterium]|nr:GTP-binding protein [Lachnospiraceae bacterium]